MLMPKSSNDTEDTLQLFRPLAESLLAGFAGRSVRLILDPTDLAADLTIVQIQEQDWIPVIRPRATCWSNWKMARGAGLPTWRPHPGNAASTNGSG